MAESVLLFYCAGIIIFVFLAFVGAVLGYSFARIAQRSASHITNSDVSAVTRAWAASSGLGWLISFAFLGLGGIRGANFISQAIYLTIAFSIIGISVSFVGVRSLFRIVARRADSE